MSRFFLRKAVLDVGGFQYRTRLFFQVDMLPTLMVGPSTQVTLYNLSHESRRRLEGREASQGMLLRAGYGENLKVIFSGKIYYTSTERHGPDVLTTLHCIDSLNAFNTARVSATGVKDDWELFNLALRAFQDYGVSKGYISDKAVAALKSAIYDTPKQFHERAPSVVERLAIKHHLRRSINFGFLNLVDRGVDITVPPLEVSKDTGMIGTPTWVNFATLKAKCFLNPDIVPPYRVRVKSIFSKASWTLPTIKVRHTGDTLEGPWETDIEMQSPFTDPSLSASSPGGD